MQINKGCSIEFLSVRTIWQLVYKNDFKCTRLMRRSLQVVIIGTRFVLPPPPPPPPHTFSKKL